MLLYLKLQIENWKLESENWKVQIENWKFYFSNLHFAIISHVLWKIGWRQGKKDKIKNLRVSVSSWFKNAACTSPVTQCLKCLTPVMHNAIPKLSAADITSLSRIEPPG